MPAQLFVSTFCYLAVPVLAGFAYRARVKGSPEALSSWRSRVGLTSILVTSADWCFVILLIIAEKTNAHWITSIDDTAFNYFIPFAGLAASALAVPLSGRARVCAAVAGLCMVAFWATAWVE